MEHFDEVDRQLILLLQANCRCSVKKLSEQLFLSPPAVSARLERLEKAGVITGFHAQVDEARLGYGIMAFVSLQLAPADKPAFIAYIEKMPNVMECNSVTGDYSMLLQVCFRTTVELDQFIGKLQRFGKTYTQIVFSNIVRRRNVDMSQSADAAL